MRPAPSVRAMFIGRSFATRRSSRTTRSADGLTARAPPGKSGGIGRLQAQLKLQNEAAQALKKQRYQNGALNLETSEVPPVILNQQIVDVAKQEKNPATDLIEDFMIAANGVVAAHAGEQCHPCGAL